MVMEYSDEYDVEMVKNFLKSLDYSDQPTVGDMNAYNTRVPENKQEAWAQFLKKSWGYRLKTLRDAMPGGNVVLGGLSPKVPLKKLFREHLNQAIELEQCQVVSISEVKPYDEYVRFRCQHCDEIDPTHPRVWVYPKDKPWVKPGKHGCDFPQIVEVTDPVNDSIDSQWIKIQETQNEASDTPQFLDCLIKGKHMMWFVGFNEPVSLIGMLRFTRTKEKDGSSSYRKWFEVFGVKKVDPEASIPLTDNDTEYIKSEMGKIGYYDKLVASFAPHIWGMETFKEAILLVLASMKLPRPARVLMVTDPSLGKSELMKYTVSLVPSAQHTQMGRSSSAGLTLSSEKDEETGRRFIVRGSAAAAHRSLLAIDEMQMGESKDFMKLNDLLESGKIRYAMAGGFRGSMDANCAILMAANPHQGRFGGSDESLGEILKFMGNDLPQFVSRINLILMKRDSATTAEEEKIARHMYRHNENDPLYLDRYRENWNDVETVVEHPFKGLTITYNIPTGERFGTKWIRKIIKHVTNNIQIEPMSPEYEDDLINYYMEHRTDVVTKVNKIVTKRFLRHGMVLAQYMARLQGQTRPDNQDIQRAMNLLQKTMEVAAFDPETQEMDVNLYNTSRSKTELEKMAKEDQLMEAIEKAMLEEDGKTRKGYFTVNDVIYQLDIMPKSKWKSDTEIERKLKEMHNKGKLMEKGGYGRFVVVD